MSELELGTGETRIVLLPQGDETLDFQGFSVRRRGDQIVVRAEDNSLHSAFAYALQDPASDSDGSIGDASQSFMRLFMGDSQGTLDGTSREQHLSDLIGLRSRIDDYASLREADPELTTFRTWLSLVVELPNDRARQHRIKAGVVTFDELPFILRPGLAVHCSVDAIGLDFGARVASIHRQTIFPNIHLLTLDAEVYAAIDEAGLMRRKFAVKIRPFDGTRSLSSLPVRPLRAEALQRFSKVGRRIVEYSSGARTVSFEGYARDLVNVENFWSEGRSIVDPATFAQLQPGFAAAYQGWFGEADDVGPDLSDFLDTDVVAEGPQPVPEEDLWRCWPLLPTFMLRARRWGIASVDSMQPVHFRRDAFDRLMLEPQLKDTIRELVEHHGHDSGDLIEGKSGGLVFLLHGEPGVGKTLTAEAVAEVLERPLYSVSAGELGSSAERVELRLREVIDLVRRWDAVLLIDEADIFLEQRDGRDIARNALVSTFLRVLDYHSGVLFLTTNRSEGLDPAVKSRVGISLHYPSHDEESRRSIWLNLMAAAGIREIDPAEIARIHLNGREIRNAIRIAQTLARSRKQPVAAAHIRRAVALVQNA